MADMLPASAQWRPGVRAVCHNEIFVSAADGGGIAAALALAMNGMRMAGMAEDDPRAVLWVQDRDAMRLSGRPYRSGLPEPLRRRLIHVAARTAEDALFALEEGLRCRDLACVVGEITGNPRALNFTASRRLSLVSEKHGVPLYLVRQDAERDLGSARMRWTMRSAPSSATRWNARAPGAPRWHAELFRARGYTSGEWILHDDGTRLVAGREPLATGPDSPSHHGDLAGQSGGRSLAAL